MGFLDFLPECSICGARMNLRKHSNGEILCVDCLEDATGTKYTPLKGAGEAYRKAYADERAKKIAAKKLSEAASRNIQVECKACGKQVAELAAVCPNCGESLPGLHIKCPKCSSEHIAITKKGFHVGQAAAGGILLGPVGLVAGMIGSKDYEFVCLGCNHRWASQK